MAVKKKLPALKRLINKIEKVTRVRPATEEELVALQKLAGGKLPEEAMDFYSQYTFDGVVRIDKYIDLYGINEIVRMNTDAVPGFMVLPFGLLTVASWVDGDAICIDLNSVGEKFGYGGCYDSQVIRQCSHELFSEGEEITFYINSGGGEVGNGLALYDVMQYISSPVRTVCVGLAASMAAVLFAAGDRREMFSHSKVMIHDPSISGRMTRNALELQVMSQDLMDTRRSLAEILAKHTGRTAEEILEKTVTDCFFDAESAIEFGLADSIIA